MNDLIYKPIKYNWPDHWPKEEQDKTTEKVNDLLAKALEIVKKEEGSE